MKRVTTELGGHAPVLIFKDANVDHAVRDVSALKFRNAGQVCIAPTRFLVHENGMISINHHGLGAPETSFGGVKDSGYGCKGGIEGTEAYLDTKFITQMTGGA